MKIKYFCDSLISLFVNFNVLMTIGQCEQKAFFVKFCRWGGGGGGGGGKKSRALLVFL